jgi:hypothetical protein
LHWPLFPNSLPVWKPEHRANQVLVLPRKAPEQNRRVGALLRGEGALHRAVKVLGLIKTRYFAQAGAFGFEALFNF